MPEPLSDQWFLNPSIVWSVAANAVDLGELTTAKEVLDFFETPWSWPELHALFLETQ